MTAWNQAPNGQRGRAAGATANPAGHVQELVGQRVSNWQGKPIPERKWICDEWIPCRQVTLLAGDSGIGKTTLALQLAAAVTVGDKWLGHQTTRTPVLAVLCEDEVDENMRRMLDVANDLGVQFEDLHDLEIVVPEADDDEEQDTSLMAFDQFTGQGDTSIFYTRILRRARKMGARLIILDTLADFFSGNENVRRHVVQFMTLMKRLSVAIDGSVVICCHPSRAGLAQGTGESGSTHWKAKSRSFIYLEKEKTEDGDLSAASRLISRLKSNYAPPFPAPGSQIRLEWHQGIYTPVVHAGHDLVDRIDRANAARTAILTCIDTLADQGRVGSDAKTAPNYLPKLVRANPGGNQFALKELVAAMEDLFRRGTIKVGPAGKHANRTARTGVVRASNTS